VDGDLAHVLPSGEPPRESLRATRISAARARAERGLVHAFGRLFDD